MTELLRGVRTPKAEYCAQGGHARFWPKNIKFAKQDQNQANGCSTCSYWCLEYEDIFFFEIGQKMAELWAKTICPSMGATAKFHSFWPITWSNINIFQWTCFIWYVRLKYTSQSISSSITAKMWTRGQKSSQKWTKSPISQFAIHTSKVGFAQIAQSPTFVYIFAWNFLGYS